MSAQSNYAQMMEEFAKVKESFFRTQWDDTPGHQKKRLRSAMLLLNIERRRLHDALAREDHDYQPHLSLTEICAIYVCIVKTNRIDSVMPDFFNQDRTSLIYQALRALNPAARLFQLSGLATAFDEITLDEIVLMLEYVPEAVSEENHPAYTGFMEHIRDVKHGRMDMGRINMLFKVAERLYEALHEQERPSHFEHRGSLADRIRPTATVAA